VSAVVGDKVDEVFIGSCMTNIGHYRAAARVLEGSSGIPYDYGLLHPHIWMQRNYVMKACMLCLE